MPAFDMNFTEAGAMTVFFIISGVGQAAAGLAVDRVGIAAGPVRRRRTARVVRCVLLGVAQNYMMLISAAAVAGAGNSVFHPADFTILNRRVSKPRLGHAFGAWTLRQPGWAATPLLMTAVARRSTGAPQPFQRLPSR